MTSAINQAKTIYAFPSSNFDFDPDVWNWKSNIKFLTLYIYTDEIHEANINWKLFNEYPPIMQKLEDKNGDGTNELMLKYNADDVKNFLGSIKDGIYSFFVSGFDIENNLFLGFITVEIKN